MKDHDLHLTEQIGEDKKLVCVWEGGLYCVRVSASHFWTLLCANSVCDLQLLEALEASQKNSRLVS